FRERYNTPSGRYWPYKFTQNYVYAHRCHGRDTETRIDGQRPGPPVQVVPQRVMRYDDAFRLGGSPGREDDICRIRLGRKRRQPPRGSRQALVHQMLLSDGPIDEVAGDEQG